MSFSKYEKIIASFLPNASIKAIQPLGNGHIHQTLRVNVMTGNSYVLQRINTKVFQQPVNLMRNLEKVADYLKRSVAYKMQVLYPIQTTEGLSYCLDEQKRYWRLFPYFSDSISLTKITHPQQAYEAAYAYGHFAWALRNFPAQELHETIAGFHDSVVRYQTFKEALKRANPDRKQAAAKWIDLLQDNLHIFHEIVALDLPKRVVHNDTKIDNVLLNERTKKGLCIIDLDTLMPGTLLSDFGDMVRTFCSSETEDSDKYEQIRLRTDFFEALSKGYLVALGDSIHSLEREHLLLGAKWIILEQCMRFLSDYLANDMYYPIQYSKHNLVRAINQMQLFQSLLRQEKELLRLLD